MNNWWGKTQKQQQKNTEAHINQANKPHCVSRVIRTMLIVCSEIRSNLTYLFCIFSLALFLSFLCLLTSYCVWHKKKQQLQHQRHICKRVCCIVTQFLEPSHHSFGKHWLFSMFHLLFLCLVFVLLEKKQHSNTLNLNVFASQFLRST